jgi:hypothetical protein
MAGLPLREIQGCPFILQAKIFCPVWVAGGKPLSLLGLPFLHRKLKMDIVKSRKGNELFTGKTPGKLIFFFFINTMPVKVRNNTKNDRNLFIQ